MPTWFCHVLYIAVPKWEAAPSIQHRIIFLKFMVERIN